MPSVNPNPITPSASSSTPQASAAKQPGAGAQEGDFRKTLDSAHGQREREDGHARAADTNDAEENAHPHHSDVSGEAGHAPSARTDRHHDGRRHERGDAQAALPLVGAAPPSSLGSTGTLLPAAATGRPASGAVTARAHLPATTPTHAGNNSTRPMIHTQATFTRIDTETTAAAVQKTPARQDSDTATRLIDASRSALPLTTLAHPATGSSTPAPSPHQLTINTPPQSAAFSQEIGQQVVWLSRQDVKQAHIQLHPRDLGPVHVNVQVHHDRVDVSFAAQHPDTVHALQQTLPQLDSMLARQGLSLGQAQVGHQHGGQHGGQSPAGQGVAGEPGPAEDAGTVTGHAATTVGSQAVGLVDAFA